MIAKIKEKLFRLLTFLGLIDSGELSRTNVLLWIFVGRFAMTPIQSASIADMAMALSAMGLYMGKKVVNAYIETKTPPANVIPPELVEKLNSNG
jgi:hypothetical protein